MDNGRIDPKAIKKVGGPAWQSLRPTFDEICSALLDVSPDAKGELTTIYIKFTSPETGGQPYAVLWIKKATELTVGFALPENTDDARLVDAPQGCKYAGLTRYLIVRGKDELPSTLGDWCEHAYRTVTEKASA